MIFILVFSLPFLVYMVNLFEMLHIVKRPKEICRGVQDEKKSIFSFLSNNTACVLSNKGHHYIGSPSFR